MGHIQHPTVSTFVEAEGQYRFVGIQSHCSPGREHGLESHLSNGVPFKYLFIPSYVSRLHALHLFRSKVHEVD